jgi:hypothetical protein
MAPRLNADPLLRRGDEPFFFGNIPLEILKRVTALPGPCLSVYLAIWHRTKLARADRPVTLPNAVALDQWNVRRDAKTRSLHALEEAGLIVIQRAVGRAWRLSLRDPRPLPRNQNKPHRTCALLCI